MKFDDAYEYLKYKYSTIGKGKIKLEKMDLNEYFTKVKHIYGSVNKELYESDKILFRQIQEMTKELNLPIEEQSGVSFLILKTHSEIIEKILKQKNIKVTNKIVLATLPTQSLNAVVGKFNNEILIAFDEGLFQFLYLMGRAVSSFFTIVNKESHEITVDFNINNIENYLENNKEGHAKFIEVLLLYLVNKNLSLSKTYFEIDDKIGLSKSLWDVAELFVAAHEYSHIVLGHLVDEIKKEFIDEDLVLYKIKRNWEKELSADELAFQVTMSHKLDSRGWFANYLGIEFLFSCFSIIEKACNIQFSETHPSSQMRIDNIRKYFQYMFPEKSKKVIEVGKIIPQLMQKLWDTNKDIIIKEYKSSLNKKIIF